MRSVPKQFAHSFAGHYLFRKLLAKYMRDWVYVLAVAWGLGFLLQSLPTFGQITLRVTDLPARTPHDAVLFLAADFNGWNPGDEAYMMSQQVDGTYQIILPAHLDTFSYKITRGNWASVEGRPNGRARINRRFMRHQAGAIIEEIQIASWEDLTRPFLSAYTIILLLSAFQGFLLVLAINSIQNNNIRANRLLSLLILVTSVGLLLRVSTFSREMFQWQPKLLIWPDLIYYAYAPLFYLYIRRLLISDSIKDRFDWWHFVPLGILFLVYQPLFWAEHTQFIQDIVDLTYQPLFSIVGGIGLAFNIYYWLRCRKLLSNLKSRSDDRHSFEQNIQYLNTVMVLFGICLVIWAVVFLLYLLMFTGNYVAKPIADVVTDVLWAVISIKTYIMGYFAMNQPEIFRVPPEPEPEVEPRKDREALMSNTALAASKEKLEQLMAADKPYLNPKLTLAELSEQMGTGTHQLSWIINEGFQRSFYDFINSYRVAEFTDMVQGGEHERETFLSIALKAGFNSITTFYRAFKKLTGTTPRIYVTQQKESV